LINLGENTLLKEEHYQHHVQVKNVIKSIIPNISQKGVFWDLTNNSTIYAYCGEGLIPPMSYPSYFYVASLKLSKKMQEQIQKNKPILVLIKGKNVEFYEGNLALRSYYLYKYLMDNYIVFTDIYDKTWMIRKGYEKLLDNSKFVKLDKLGDQDVLSEALDYKTLDGYPKSWGNSVSILKNKLCNPIDLSPTYINKTTIGLVGDENLTGDFLYLKFNRQINSRWITIAWEDNFNNKGKNFIAFWGGTNEYLVPLFASTNWYLGYNKNNLIIQHKDNLSEPLVLTEVKLYNRIISNKN
jgi:hypothetical protein